MFFKFLCLGIDLVTSSQTLREKDIQPSKLNFGFLGLGKEYNQDLLFGICNILAFWIQEAKCQPKPKCCCLISFYFIC